MVPPGSIKDLEAYLDLDESQQLDFQKVLAGSGCSVLFQPFSEGEVDSPILPCSSLVVAVWHFFSVFRFSFDVIFVH